LAGPRSILIFRHEIRREKLRVQDSVTRGVFPSTFDQTFNSDQGLSVYVDPPPTTAIFTL